MVGQPFTATQLDRFSEDGFIVVPGVVDPARRDACLRRVNHWLFTEFDPSAVETYRQQSYAPPLIDAPETMGLLTETPAFGLASALVGQPLLSPTHGQLALRFPAEHGPRWTPGAHIDGLPTRGNGLPDDGRVHGFSILAGVLLSDVEHEDLGNLLVWPGTHLRMAAWFAEHGTTFTDAGVVYDAAAEIAASSAPVSWRGRAGDLVLAHFLLLHSAGRHAGPDIRYVAYFRLHTTARDALGDTVYTDAWAEWPAIRDRGRRVRGGGTRGDES